MELSELLKEIRKHPPLYLNKYSIFTFHAYLNGYSYAKMMYKISNSEHDKKFDDFLEWLENDFPPQKIRRSWSDILYIYSSDERKALDKFFELYDNYFSSSKDDENLADQSQ
jgi:hypothetical protein